MNLEKFLSKFDLKRFKTVFKITLILFILVICINLIGITYSKYESGASMNTKANIAFFLVKSGTYENSIVLDGLTPRTEPFIYTFNVSNFKGSNVTAVDLTYHITFSCTTNLPLTYDIYRNQSYSPSATSVISSSSITQDGDMYYRVFETNTDFSFSHTAASTDQYTLAVWYPVSYKNYPEEYSGVIDMFIIQIHAEQVV